MKDDGRCAYYETGNREKTENRRKKLAEDADKHLEVGKVGNRKKIVKGRD